MAKQEDYRLRPLEEPDLEMVLRWRNLEHIRANMYTDHIITMEEHQAWFDRISKDKKVCYLVSEFQNRSIGLVYFTNIDSLSNKCYWGFYLGEADVPLGSGSAMEFLALDYAFEILKIRKLCCEVLAFNNKVIKHHKKFCFQEEGTFVQQIFKNNRYEDIVCLALFRDKWSEEKTALQKLVFRTKKQ